MTVRALEVAAERGIDHAILHSSQAGYAIYRRLGFEEHGTLRAFVTPPSGG
jgi:predicted GNAT family acetyltransferase